MWIWMIIMIIACKNANAVSVWKSVRKISGKLSLVIFLSQAALLQQPLALKVWKKTLYFTAWTFSLECYVKSDSPINKEKKGYFEDFLSIYLRPTAATVLCIIIMKLHYLTVPTSYASHIINVSVVNANARIEALGKAAWYRDISIIGLVGTNNIR